MVKTEYAVDPSIIDALNPSPIPTPEEVYELFEEYAEEMPDEDAWDLACIS